MRLEDRVTIITGGSQGIGREYALRFAREGADVVIADVRTEQAEEVAHEVEKLGRRGLAIKTDVSVEDETRALADQVVGEFGRIDVLVNNAAIYYGMDRENQSLEYFNKILSVNMTGVWLTTRAVSRPMRHAGRGKIINQSSTAAYIGNMGLADTSDPDAETSPFHYSVAKSGVNGLTKFFAGALGPFGINVNAIAPGVTMTEATKQVVPENMIDMLVMVTALRKPLQPDDLAGTAVYLASSDSDMMTGQVLVVDGGMFMLG